MQNVSKLEKIEKKKKNKKKKVSSGVKKSMSEEENLIEPGKKKEKTIIFSEKLVEKFRDKTKDNNGKKFQMRLFNKYMHRSRLSGNNAPVASDSAMRTLILNYLDGRIFRVNGNVMLRDDEEKVWLQHKQPILSYLHVFIEAQDFKKLNSKGFIVDYFKGLGEISSMCNHIYTYKLIPDNDSLHEFISLNTRGKINYPGGLTYHLKFKKFRKTKTKEFNYVNCGVPPPIENLEKKQRLFNEIQKAFGDQAGWFLAHFSRIMAGFGILDKKLTLVSGPRHSAKGTILSFFSKAFGSYVSCGPMNFFLCNQNDKLSDPDGLNKHIAGIMGISWCRLVYSTEMYSKDQDINSRFYNHICLNGTYSRSLNGGGDWLALRKLFHDTIMVIQVGCIVLQSNTTYPVNPKIAEDTIVSIKTEGKFLEPHIYEIEKKKGTRNIYLRDPLFRSDPENLNDQLIFLLSDFYQEKSVPWPKANFDRLKKKSNSVLFLEIAKKYIFFQENAKTPRWPLDLFLEKFKEYLPEKLTPHGLLNLLYPDCHFPSQKKSALDRDGKTQTLSVRVNLFFDHEIFKINFSEEINKLSVKLEDEEDLLATKQTLKSQVECTDPTRKTPNIIIRDIPEFMSSPSTPVEQRPRSLFS
jgi:hypothetical protein